MNKSALYALLIIALSFPWQSAGAATKAESDQKVKYSSYQEMIRTEKSGVDFKVVYRAGSRSFLVAAPHGGQIEPGSSELADAIAGDTFGFYAFVGLKRDSSDLFLPSSGFSEPELTRVSKTYSTIVAIHVIPGSERLIYVGGNYRQVADFITRALASAGYQVKAPPEDASAYSATNFINKSIIGGVQIELSSAIVEDMFRGPATNERIRQDRTRRTPEFNRFVQAVTAVLERHGGRSSAAPFHPKEEKPPKKK